jgi:hypothetical protein
LKRRKKRDRDEAKPDKEVAEKEANGGRRDSRVDSSGEFAGLR